MSCGRAFTHLSTFENNLTYSFFRPPVWFICMLSVNHLLLVLNCVMNFVVYCCFNSGFKKVVWPSR